MCNQCGTSFLFSCIHMPWCNPSCIHNHLTSLLGYLSLGPCQHIWQWIGEVDPLGHMSLLRQECVLPEDLKVMAMKHPCGKPDYTAHREHSMVHWCHHEWWLHVHSKHTIHQNLARNHRHFEAGPEHNNAPCSQLWGWLLLQFLLQPYLLVILSASSPSLPMFPVSCSFYP